ncbi:MAG TPA: hypothetical protein VHC63_09325 [Acidimicrobiales bacterium]|nr:hypothetical protein [Acidimicrobiales bacterium]
MFKKTLLFLVTALMLASASAALAQTGTYPANSAIVVRDVNGNIVDGTHGLHVGDPMHIHSTGWKPGSSVAFDFFSTVIHLGDVNADASGAVDATFPVPNVEPGQHTLRLTGIGADGKPRTVDYPILVVPASQVLGSTLDSSGSSSALGSSGGTSTGTGGVFGKTGLDHALDIAGVGLALLAVGLVLSLAVRRSRREDALV